MMLLVESRNFVMLFVALETVTIGLYILVSYYRSSAATLEAGLKYLVMGALSSALLLFGIVLLYGVAGSHGLEGRTEDALLLDVERRFPLGALPETAVAVLSTYQAVRTAKPRFCSFSQACTPDAASRPKAEPPASAIASMPSTVCAGSSSADSRVPGPPPRTSIEATAGWSKTIAVDPEPSRRSSAWPTFTPGTSVMRLRNAIVTSLACLHVAREGECLAIAPKPGAFHAP